MRIAALIFIFMSMISPSYGKDKTITICSYEWPPHHGPELKNEGYTSDIIKEIFNFRGYKVKKIFLPWKRAQLYAKEGKRCDAITEIYFNKERLNYYGSICVKCVLGGIIPPIV
jgi:polar amino acid transport system substrate-binding protein